LLGCFCNLHLFRRLLLFPKSALRWRFLGALLAFRLSVSRFKTITRSP